MARRRMEERKDRKGGVSGEDSSFPWESDGQPNYGYDAVVEQGFYDTAEAPSSYFSLDRNTANYAYVRAQIMREDKVAPDSVRLEELVNYFSYDYPAPEAGEGIAVTPYLADCPWNAEHKLLTLGIPHGKRRSGRAAAITCCSSTCPARWAASSAGWKDRRGSTSSKLGANKLVDSLGAATTASPSSPMRTVWRRCSQARRRRRRTNPSSAMPSQSSLPTGRRTARAGWSAPMQRRKNTRRKPGTAASCCFRTAISMWGSPTGTS